MNKQYLLIVFLFCFFIWTALVDNCVLPSMDKLQERSGLFSHYRTREVGRNGKFNLLKDELVVYVHVKSREEIYYIERTPAFEMVLKNVAPGARVKLGYAKRFPKVWKQTLYSMEIEGQPLIQLFPWRLADKQRYNWKVTGVVAGLFVFLGVLGFINKPRGGRRV
ncbi:hypothetical protein PDESU_04142 [Pontiella desulfatans]|uniref:Uncharacterized protein n=1 Tax=Pontiella desulfatans TaxID=2750659 RepID=A0A6C2U6Y4_PONDE|nr:hypothetical protein [Pontiella desulfatans]VGO15557.1 hypothetical protein PDESU_04142 [Pontiella desulfatans]